MARDNAYTRFLSDPDPAARRAELEAFVGPNSAPFLKMYERLRASPARPGFGAMQSFVVMAFFLGPCWFFYRRMWGWAWGFIAVLVVMALLPLPRTAGLIAGVVLATQGRYAYLTHAFGRIEKLRDAGAGAGADLDVLRRAGGVSATAGWVSIAAYVLLSLAALAAIYLSMVPAA